jgi:hypothetical protein
MKKITLLQPSKIQENKNPFVLLFTFLFNMANAQLADSLQKNGVRTDGKMGSATIIKNNVTPSEF